jgi:hydroxypyruvate isomerase
MRRVMLRDYSACIEMLFVPEAADFAERVQLAADAGFETIEFWGAANKNVEKIAVAAKQAGVRVGCLLAEPGLAWTNPTNHQRILEGLGKSREIALKLGATSLIVVAGDKQPGMPLAAQRAAIVACLSRAADVMKGTGIVLALEPINTGERPNGYLFSTREGLDIVDEVGRPEVKLLYDMYHSAVMGESLPDVLAGRVDRIAHVHLADHPGRHEPGSGRIRWQEGLAWLRANGYAGKVGLEYRPAGGTVDGLRFLD